MRQKLNRLEQVSKDVSVCRKCRLSESRKNPVPGEGNLDAVVLFIGEAPGRKEDDGGKPFVGAAGRFFNEMLAAAGLRREDVFITNAVKCRPPLNRKPRKDEIASCRQHLSRQLDAIKPRLVCPMGKVALYSVSGVDDIAILHGKPFEKEGYCLFPLYHPAAGIYNRNLRETMLSDMKKVAQLIG